MKEIKDRKILLVYNTCGIKRDNTEWYKECISSFLEQDFEGIHVVISSCMNSMNCFKELYSHFPKGLISVYINCGLYLS